VGMSGPPQRPPPAGAFIVGHVRPPLHQPAPVLQGAGGGGGSMRRLMAADSPCAW
jgi:hypothetical protein